MPRLSTKVGLGFGKSRIVDEMRAQQGVFDPRILELVGRVIEDAGDGDSVRGVTLLELRTGMVLKEEVRASGGLLLVAAGQEVTVSLLERIQNYNDTVGLKLPLWVEVPADAAPDEAPPEAFAGRDPEFNFS